MTLQLGTVAPVAVRTLWPNEAHDFTPWLADQLPQLAEALGLDGLELVEREAAIGSFSLDLLARETGTGRRVVIENQFGSTDHDHLGKLLTYAAGTDAHLIIWLAETLRDEHREALEWLNRHTDAETQFFAVSVEAFRVDDSRPAIRFVAHVQPNEWQRQTRALGGGASLTGRAQRYREFFQRLIDELRETHRFGRARAAQPQSWYAFSSGMSDVRYVASFAQQACIKADVYIGSNDREWNKAMFDALKTDSALIEAEFGGTLSWERLDHRSASRIVAVRAGSIDDSNDELAEHHRWFVATLLKLRQVFGRRLPVVANQIETTAT